MSLRELFDFITDVSINKDNIDEYLEKIQEDIRKREASGAEADYETQVCRVSEPWCLASA